MLFCPPGDTSDAPFIVMGHGGFLGMGEKYVKLSLGDVRYRPRDKRFFVSTTDDKLRGEPGLEKVEGQWRVEPLAEEAAEDRTQG